MAPHDGGAIRPDILTFTLPDVLTVQPQKKGVPPGH